MEGYSSYINVAARMNPGSEKTRNRRWRSLHALVHLVADGIICDLYVRSGNSREQSVTYELVISNETDAGISCRLYGIDAAGHTREFGMLTIRALSAGNSFFSVPVETGDRRRLFLEVVGDGINLFAEALQPAAIAKARWPVFALASVVVVGMSALGSAYVRERPSIESFVVPALTEPGRIRAFYVTGGSARVRYRAMTVNGSLIESGILIAPSGELALHIPPSAAGQTIRVVLDASGPLGNAERKISVNVLARRAPVGVAIHPAGRVVLSTHTPGQVALAPHTPGQVALAPSLAPTQPDSEGPPSDVISLPGRVLAGKTFRVSIRRRLPGLRIQFKDALEAIVTDVAVPANTGSIQLFAPASPVVETYSLASTFERGASMATSIQSLRVYPQ